MVIGRDRSMLGIHKPIMLNASRLLIVDLLESAQDLGRRVTLVTVIEQVTEEVAKLEWKLLSIL